MTGTTPEANSPKKKKKEERLIVSESFEANEVITV